MGKSIHIDDIPADGVELTEDDLANLIGGLPPRHDRSSQTLNYDVGMCDMDEDF
ncbi:MAG TPA: putative ATP-grasp target RiPP [Micromonosporaceae bacterium]|nr:putative ATP-grasp target RiPP [Micromonosporaceae bacterium]